MRYITLTLRLSVAAYAAYLLYFLATTEGPALSGFYTPPLGLRLMDMINLFIHEGGHFFTRPFGMFIYILGGSLVQCVLPLALLIVMWRMNIAYAGYAGFWLGENFVNVSYYIRDAPYKQLKLIAAGLIHDWNWLLGNDADTAEMLGVLVYGFGILVCLASLCSLAVFAAKNFRDEE